MGTKRHIEYTSFQYLEAGTDYRAFEVASDLDRVESSIGPNLSADEEARVSGCTPPSLSICR